MTQNLKKFVADESGATAIEYALIASLVSVSIIVALQTLGGKMVTAFNEISANLK